jgi:mandelate racemase
VASPILAEPLRPIDGAIQAPAHPGIGLQWNEEAVKRYRVG